MKKIRLQPYHLIPPLACYILGLVSPLDLGVIDQKLEDMYWVVYTLQFIFAILVFFVGYWVSGLDPSKIPHANADFIFKNSLRIVWQFLVSILRLVLIGAFEAGTITLVLFRLMEMSNELAGVIFIVLSVLFIALYAVYSYFGNKEILKKSNGNSMSSRETKYAQ